MLTLQLLGSPQIVWDEARVDLRSAKAKALLFYLAVTQRSYSRLVLASLLWPDKSDTEARTNLRQAVHLLHQVIPDCLVTTRDSLQLNPQLTVAVDALHFEALALRGLKDEDGVACDDYLRAAADSYKDEFLFGFHVDDAEPFEEWARLLRERLHLFAFHVLERLATLSIARQEIFGGLHYAQGLLAMEPWNENAHFQIIQLLTMNGQPQAALAQYEQCRQLLQEHLNAKPGEEITRFVDAIRQGALVGQIRTQAAASAAVDLTLSQSQQNRPPHNLSAPLSSFVGQRRALARLQQLFSEPEPRLVSLIGPGGVGKTRLATHLGRQLLAQFHDGVWFIDLLTVGDKTPIELVVYGVLGIHATSQDALSVGLASHLADKECLLIFDNCEHVIDSLATLVIDLLRVAPRLRLLATSREPLRVSGEQPFRVSPLPLPDAHDANTAERIRDCESVQLFVERAVMHTPTFAVTDANAPVIVQICRMLDGIPLAIELVAARTQMFSVTQIAQQLTESPNAQFHLARRAQRDKHVRHQTLHNLIEWSYQLLPPKERRLFERLAVFDGNWSLAAVREVCTIELAAPPLVDVAHASADDAIKQDVILDRLANLIDKSLVVAEPHGFEMRYRLLETIHRFALQKLVASGAEDDARDRHLAYFMHRIETWELPPAEMSRTVWQAQIMPDLANIRAALGWALQRGAVQWGLRLATSAGEFWFSKGLHRESIHWLQLFLNLPWADQEKMLCLTALSQMEFTHWWALGNYAQARVLQSEALRLAEELGDLDHVKKILNDMGGVALRQGDYINARRYLEQSLALSEQSGDSLNQAWSLLLLGEVMLAQHDLTICQRHFDEAACLLRMLQNRSLLAYPIRRLGQIAHLQQNLPVALAYYRESLELNCAAGELEGKAACVAAYASAFLDLGATAQATLLCATVATALAASQSQLNAFDAQVYADLVTKLHRLDDSSFDDAWATGAKLSFDAVPDLIEQWLASDSPHWVHSPGAFGDSRVQS
ncbi:MAG: tetratricopeptide repeat protein [Caldilinea sp.]